MKKDITVELVHTPTEITSVVFTDAKTGKKTVLDEKEYCVEGKTLMKKDKDKDNRKYFADFYIAVIVLVFVVVPLLVLWGIFELIT